MRWTNQVHKLNELNECDEFERSKVPSHPKECHEILPIFELHNPQNSGKMA